MYISRRSMVKTKYLANTSIILGPSIIGENTIIDHNVVIGYPTRKNLRTVLKENPVLDENKYYELLDKASNGSKIGSYCHIRPGSTVYEKVILGDHVETGHNVMIREETVVGEHTIIGTHTIIDGYVRIGSHVRIETGVYIPPETIIEDNVFLGPFVVITNDRYPLSKRLKGAIIRRNAVIGANAVLVAGVEIGENAVVAAGSVVTKNIPPNTVVAGVPAKTISTREEFEEKKKLWEKGLV